MSAVAFGQSLAKQQVGTIDSAVAEFMKANNVPTVSVAVGSNGKVVFSKAYGVADLELQVPATPQTRFRTGSIAKPLTAVGAMELVEQHKLNLDDPVQQYCPVFPKKQWTVTTRELMSHRAGVRHYTTDAEGANTRHFASLNDSISGIFGNDPLLFEPGTKMSYSTYGYVIVGCVMEGASGTPYSKFMAENVFGPAGMTNTSVDDSSAIIPNRVHFYDRNSGKVVNAQYFDSSDRIPGGGFVSTPEDLVRFAFALESGKLISADSLKLMWTSAGASADRTYGLGWFLTTNPDGRRIVFHTGGQIGASTMLTVAPDDHMVYAIMTNVRGQSLGKLSEAIEKAVLPAKTAVSFPK